MFGALIFILCCNNLAAMNNMQKAIDHLGRYYSADLKSVALFLISKSGSHKVYRSFGFLQQILLIVKYRVFRT